MTNIDAERRMTLVKRKIGNSVCFMPDGEYSLCGNAFDGDNGEEVFGADSPLTNVRQITCLDCRNRISKVRELIKAKGANK